MFRILIIFLPLNILYGINFNFSSIISMFLLLQFMGDNLQSQSTFLINIMKLFISIYFPVLLNNVTNYKKKKNNK